MKVFATYPTVQMENVGWLPIGYPPHAKMKKYKKSIDWFLQVKSITKVEGKW